MEEIIRDRYFSCSEINSLDNESTNHEDIWTHITKTGIVQKIRPEYFLSRKGRKTRICQATIVDSTGETNLTIWEEDIDRVKNGSKIKISNGLAKKIKGVMHISTGYAGRLIILGPQIAKKRIDKVKRETPEAMQMSGNRGMISKSPSVLAPVRSY